MDFIKVTALKAGQENTTYINMSRIISIGEITLSLPVEGTGDDDKEPATQEITMTAINLDGAPAILVKETPAEVLAIMGE